jgi:chemotaxis signal transduction protein
MKNVIVVALGGDRFAIELRWVREIFTLTHLTPIPTAPPVIAGAVNYRGAIVPVLSAHALLQGVTSRPMRAPRAGDAMILLDVDDTRAALAVDRVDAVTTLTPSPRPEVLMDPRGVELPLIEPPALLQAARKAVGDDGSRA